jgi:enoyl-CoA hydratase/carnithine racemase
MGRYRAMKLVLTGDAVGAEEALALGMISEVVPDGAARAQALALAARVVEMPPVAVHAIKQVINLGQDVPLETALALERQAFVSLFGGEDQREGMRAFLEKRAPVYTGR